MNDHKQRNLVTSGIINIISFRANQGLIIYRIQLNDVIVLPFVMPVFILSGTDSRFLSRGFSSFLHLNVIMSSATVCLQLP
jgi:hypothetical protein